MTHAPADLEASSSPSDQTVLSALKKYIPSPVPPSLKVSEQLHEQCLALLSEVDHLQGLLQQTLRNPQLVEVRQFRSNVIAELKMLQKLEQRFQSCPETPANSSRSKVQNSKSRASDAESDGNEAANEEDDDDESTVEMRLMHALRSSNLPFYQAVWGIAKDSCCGLSALGKRFYWDAPVKRREKEPKVIAKQGGGGKQPNKDKRKSVFVDIVADDGEEWVKVSTMSESRLLFEMAKKGWERDSEDECFSDAGSEAKPRRTVLRNFEGSDDDADDDEDELELIKLARDLRKAADATRLRYKHPRLRVVLSKIQEGNVPEIDDLLCEMRSYGVKVVCQDALSEISHENSDLSHLLPRPFKRFTETLNVDCTLLLALVSDLSHAKEIELSPSFHRAILRQIEVEKQQPLLPTELWPAMGGHELICTIEAALRMREIVQLIGTETEKERTKIMMGDAPYTHIDRVSAIEKFQALSDWQVPANWKIPIKVVDAQPAITAAEIEGTLPSLAKQVAEGLSDINHSVFMYGWATGMTTISSNRTIDKQIEATVEKNRGTDETLEGPMVWICDTARSLAGKEKDRRP
ncbi:Uncharacterized protein PECH_003383 [Penicillium ucsense]|uniref:DUF1308 domain-containing protein n=1 Tax=Penicillium ucsense TaxID=2839758 RepID=A0A8J8WCY2_9EURO|nr:Uncharacterized protein PECM_000193 [Penicillium ucsense]KAF7739406.1 Uncharacterized protein PECH_003383 [Penicillium ucsense]